MADVGHCSKFTFDRISGHFRSIYNFNFLGKFLTKWLPAAILDVRNSSQAARHLYPAWTVKVFFSLDFIYLVSLDRISGGYQEDILEQFEKSKMAAKMAAIVKKN